MTLRYEHYVTKIYNFCLIIVKFILYMQFFELINLVQTIFKYVP